MRVIVVHTVEQAVTALQAAAAMQTPVILQSAPDAIFYAGSLYLLHMFEQAQKEVPAAHAVCIADCADAEGEAISAMQMGHRHIRSSAAENVRSKLAEIAAQHDITLHADAFEALDLIHARDPKSACAEWLKKN